MKGKKAQENGSKAARILVADDHELARSGLLHTLATDPELEAVGEAKDGAEAVSLCRELLPDLVLMDVTMPKMNGLEATRQIKQDLPSISVAMVTVHEDPTYLLEALKAGAAGYILKDATRTELIEAVRKVLGGESLLNPELATRLLRKLASEKDQDQADTTLPQDLPEPQNLPSDELLTPREAEILRLLVRGLSNPQIAQSLMVSRGTVQVHVHHIIRKLGVSDRTQAVVKAIRLGLVAPK